MNASPSPSSEIQKLLEKLSIDSCACSDTNPDGSIYHCQACIDFQEIHSYIRTLEANTKRPHDLDAAYDDLNVAYNDLYERSKSLEKDHRSMREALNAISKADPSNDQSIIANDALSSLTLS